MVTIENDTILQNKTGNGARQAIDVDLAHSILLWTAAEDMQLSFDSDGTNFVTIGGEMQQKLHEMKSRTILYFNSASGVINYQLLSN